MTKKTFAHSKQNGGPIKSRQALTQAYLRLFDTQDGQMVLADLANITGYYRRPSYGQWMAKTRTPQGFELHSALSNARAEVVQHIMDFLTLSEDQLVALERAARAEAR
jgi:hypothetical protein